MSDQDKIRLLREQLAKFQVANQRLEAAYGDLQADNRHLQVANGDLQVVNQDLQVTTRRTTLEELLKLHHDHVYQTLEVEHPHQQRKGPSPILPVNHARSTLSNGATVLQTS